MDCDDLLVAALGAAVLTGCTTSSRPAPDPTAAPRALPSPEDPDAAVLRAWLREERRLAARYAAVVRRVPALAALPRNHTARAGAVTDHLRSRGIVPDPAPVAPTPRPLRRPAPVMAALARAEREAAARYVAALAGVRDPRVAVLGAELAAGARQHATLLGLVPVPR